MEEYLKLMFSMLGVKEEERELLGMSFSKSFEKKKNVLGSIFKK